MSRNPKRRQAVQQVRQERTLLSVSQSFQGPLPPPSLLEHYDALVPGAAARIMAQWEAQTSHRQQLERATILGNLAAQSRGQYLSFLIALFVLALAGFLVFRGKDGWAFATVVSALASLVGVFLVGRGRQDAERAHKQRAS